MKKSDLIKEAVMAQEAEFSPHLIAGVTGASVPYVQNVITPLVELGQLLEIKRGKKNLYRKVENTENGDSTSITFFKQNNANPMAEYSVAERFQFAKDLTQMVCEDCTPSFFLTGSSGIGKTHLVREVFAMNGFQEGEHYTLVKGHITPFALFELLWHRRNNGLILFDDADTAFDNEISANILKAALDSYSTRRVSWRSRSIPEDSDIEREFDFEGNVIFISNVPLNKVDSAIKSRTLTMSLSLTRAEISEYMVSIIDRIEPSIPVEQKHEALTFLDNKRDCFVEYTLRTLIKAARIRARYNDEKQWQGLILATASESQNEAI